MGFFLEVSTNEQNAAEFLTDSGQKFRVSCTARLLVSDALRHGLGICIQMFNHVQCFSTSSCVCKINRLEPINICYILLQVHLGAHMGMPA